jgi:hypothetical protein
VQSAYRAADSTKTAILKVLNDLLSSFDNGNAVILTLLDQSAAFNTITILLDCLSPFFGVSSLSLAWFASYLDGRRQSVSVRGVTSTLTPSPLVYGVPQGSVLVLFCTFFTILPSTILQNQR